ncbi:MAG: DNA-3-methyladenine glycosylase I [Microbacteriaceae bacterium]
MSRSEIVVGEDGISRCGWVGSDVDYIAYHDTEWGRPLRDSQRLYEKVCLEGFQAGLSWITILRRREAFRSAFQGFDPAVVAQFTEADVERMLADVSIIRHRGKIEAAISNARATLELDVPLADLIWRYAPSGSHARPQSYADIPAVTEQSTALSTELRKRGFRFVGPTTMYALMQSAGLVDDHLAACHRAA